MSESSSIWLALAMGAIQGVSEFLPISSSGHLAAFGLFSSHHLSLQVVVLLHAATLLATLLVFWSDLQWLAVATFKHRKDPRAFLGESQGKLLVAIVIACIPTAVIGLLLEKRVEALSATPWIVGVGFLASALTVLSTRSRGGDGDIPNATQAFVIGLVQGIAVLPGISRSAVTIASAMAFGLSGAAAFRFSFLLSMPAIFGATLLELGKPEVLSGLDATAWLGALSALLTGCAALVLLRRMLQRGHFWLFAFYLVPLGAVMILLQLGR